MITNAKRMSCGGCGAFVFLVYSPPVGMSHSIYLECGECKSVSVIKPSEPSLIKEWGPNATGIICVMPE